MAQEGTFVRQGALATRIVQAASRHDLLALGLGESAVEIDGSMADSDAYGQGGRLETLAKALIEAADKGEYDDQFERLIASNSKARAALEPSERPAPIGHFCARGRAAEVDSPLQVKEIEGDIRGHETFGILAHLVRHGFPARSTLGRCVDVQPVMPSYTANRADIAAAQAKEIAAGFTKVIGSVPQCVDFVSSVCDCQPAAAYICEGTGSVDKLDQDNGGVKIGVRTIHSALKQNRLTGSLPFCECDGPHVGVKKGLDIRQVYINRGWRPDQVVLLAEKRDWKHAYKHNMIAPCSLFLMGVRLALVMCVACGRRRTAYSDNECTCPDEGATQIVDSFGLYMASSFGTRASAFNFGLLGNAFKWMMHEVLRVPLMSLYVDDTFSVGVAIRHDDGSVSEVGVDREHRLSWASFAWTKLSARWGISESGDKRIAGSAILNLGVVIDFFAMEIRLAPNRMQSVRDLLVRWLKRSSSTRKELQSLRGVLGWSSMVVHGGYVVLKLLDAAVRQFPEHRHFRSRVAAGTKRAAAWLLEIFQRHSGSKMILTSDWIQSAVLDLATDASGGAHGGFGGYFGLSYFAGRFPPGMTLVRTIAELELATVIVALLAFGHLLRGRRIVMSCDNANANSAVRKGSANSSMLQYLAMAVHKIADFFGIDMRITWIASKDNKLADLASRNRAAFIALVRSNGVGEAREVRVKPELFATIFAGFTEPWSWEWTTSALAGLTGI